MTQISATPGSACTELEYATRECTEVSSKSPSGIVSKTFPGKGHVLGGQLQEPTLSAPQTSATETRLGSRVASLAFAPLRYLLTSIGNTITLACKVDRCFDSACKRIADSTDKNKLFAKREKEMQLQEKNIKKLKRINRQLKKTIWGDIAKNSLIALLRVQQYIYRTFLNEVKTCLTDGTDLHDHFVLTGHQMIPDHFFDALNASRANSLCYGPDGVGVLPLETTAGIMSSKTRFGILRLLYGDLPKDWI